MSELIGLLVGPLSDREIMLIATSSLVTCCFFWLGCNIADTFTVLMRDRSRRRLIRKINSRARESALLTGVVYDLVPIEPRVQQKEEDDKAVILPQVNAPVQHPPRAFDLAETQAGVFNIAAAMEAWRKDGGDLGYPSSQTREHL